MVLWAGVPDGVGIGVFLSPSLECACAFLLAGGGWERVCGAGGGLSRGRAVVGYILSLKKFGKSRSSICTMFININRTSFHLWRKENSVKHQKMSKYSENDCLQNFLLLFMSFLAALIVQNRHI